MVAGFRAGTISIGFSGWSSKGVPPRSGVKQQGDLILITPFDKAVVPSIVRALNEAHLNTYALNPSTVSISIPPISVPRSPGTSRSWARTPRSPSG
jgi:hypothetical protein